MNKMGNRLRQHCNTGRRPKMPFRSKREAELHATAVGITGVEGYRCWCGWFHFGRAKQWTGWDPIRDIELGARAYRQMRLTTASQFHEVHRAWARKTS